MHVHLVTFFPFYVSLPLSFFLCLSIFVVVVALGGRAWVAGRKVYINNVSSITGWPGFTSRYHLLCLLGKKRTRCRHVRVVGHYLYRAKVYGTKWHLQDSFPRHRVRIPGRGA